MKTKIELGEELKRQESKNSYQKAARATPEGREKKRTNDAAWARKRRSQQGKDRKIAVLDFETDPFGEAEEILPFTCCIYSPDLGHKVFWSLDHHELLQEIVDFLESLTEKYLIYAHNGGNFDWKFLSKYIRGSIDFREKTIMKANLCGHEIRDSYFLLPVPLSAIQKDEFDYKKMIRTRREKYKDEIIKYMCNDCTYTYNAIKKFIDTYGLKLTVGQASLAECRKVVKIERLSEACDEEYRTYFFGGKVDMLQGAGRFEGDYYMYDVNSMYPYVMAYIKHPLGSCDEIRTKGGPNEHTYFLEIECTNNKALVRRDKNGLTSDYENGTFFTTIHEYNVALKFGKIRDVVIKKMYDFYNVGTLEDFVLPLYEKRKAIKKQRKLEPTNIELVWEETNIKLILNAAFGKQAQNPRDYVETYMTDKGEYPPDDAGRGEGLWGVIGVDGDSEPNLSTPYFDLWERPNPGKRFNNVALAASITGASRAKLNEAIFQADDPIYCDTDSIICKKLNNVEIHGENLGAWKLEHHFNEVLIAGKKMYACRYTENGVTIGKPKIRHKGISKLNGLSWEDFEKIVDKNESIRKEALAPNIKITGKQVFMHRTVRVTGKRKIVKSEPDDT